MTAFKSRIRIRYLANQSKIKERIKKIDQATAQRINRLYKDIFGDTTEFTDWEGSKAGSTKRKVLTSPGKISQANRSKALGQFKNLYVQAWKNKYQKIMNDYKLQDKTYKSKRWYKRKKKSFFVPSHMSQSKRPVRYSSPGLATGFLREKIAEGMQTGKGPYVTLGNILVSGGFKVNFAEDGPFGRESKYRSPHYAYFVNYMADLGVLDSIEEFSTFLPEDWKKIAAYLEQMVQDGFIRGVEDVISNLREII